MRTDISQDIIEKTSDRLQNDANNSSPRLSLVISRKEVFLDDFDFTERRRVRRTTSDSISDVGIAVCHPRLNHEDESIWVCYCRNDQIYLRRSDVGGDISDVSWSEVNIGAPSGTKCDIGFISNAQTNRQGVTEYITAKKPLVFFLSSGIVKYIDVADPQLTVHTLFSLGAMSFSVRQTPLGLGVFYNKLTNLKGVYYRIHGVTGWGSEEYVDEDLDSNIVDLSTFNIPDGFGIQAYSNSKLYRIIGDENLAFDEWFEVGDANGTGAIVEYPDGQREAFFDATTAEATGEDGGFCYSKGNDEWYFNASNRLYGKHYSVIEFDHTNQGTIYFATLLHGSEDIVYMIRYMYSKDVSSYTKEVTKTLQIDNPITQINAELKNISDALYTSNATIFAPSSMMRLGVSYGNSEIVDLGIAFIDQATFTHGGDTVTLSGRNRTGVFLRDQTFGEDMEFNDTPFQLIEQIGEIFGMDDIICDDSEKANGTTENPRIITLIVEATTTGLQALETLNKLLTDDAAGDKWDFEELSDGTIIVGYDDFRSEYNPKGNYVFNGISDVFAKSIDRSIDGVYSKVRCTGTTAKGKEISYTYNVTNFRFWDAGENRIYHAPHVDGITKTELKKYAKALAKQLKYIGRVITYKMNLKPQLIIGDVARITYGQDEGETEQLGSITEINHTLGDEGCFTEFTITSGGDITDVSPTVVYVADKSARGTNRKKRMSDYFGGGSENSSSVSAKTTIIQGGDFDYIEYVRNDGRRFLDEPSHVQITYDEDENEVKIKWVDPVDLADFKPIPVEWLGTVVVRNENGAPKHPWDGVQVVNSTTRNAYQNNWFVDDNNVLRGNVYYYGIFPYCMALDDANHPIYRYRYTKVVSVNTGLDLQPAIITNLEVDVLNVMVSFEIPALRNGSYASVTLVAKKDGTPLSVDDGDEFITLTDTDTSAEVSWLDAESHYYFVIFSEDDQGNTATSEPQDCVTGENLIPPELQPYVDLLASYDVGLNQTSSLLNCQDYSGNSNTVSMQGYSVCIGGNFNENRNSYDCYVMDNCNIIVTTNDNSVSVDYSCTMAPYDTIKTHGRSMWGEYSHSGNRIEYLAIGTWTPAVPLSFYQPYNVDSVGITFTTSFNTMLECMQYLTAHFRRCNLKVNGNDWLVID